MAATKEKAPDITSLVSVLSNAKQDDLDAIDARVRQLQQEIDKYVVPRQSEILALKKLSSLISARLHPRPKKPREPSGNGVAKSRKPTELHQRIFDLLHAEGSMPVPAIAARLGLREQAVSISLTYSDWFERRNGEVHIATKKAE